MNVEIEKVIIVEGKTDKQKLKEVISEPVTIICTNGTISTSKLDMLVDDLVGKDVYILADSDDAGDKLRKQFRKEFPEALHLFVDRTYREVAASPSAHIASILLAANIDVHSKYL
ncbi:toprim domain-containing protein [Bacillus safensis]|uniref:toprim domain-containing protein n=1 Tax=Bacillus safensis TaxID=561879 RepID=UPI002481A566|nr:toprim domain-containing protein [Bacillus safensis]MDI0188201.1 toprim domain-containing protein [Bacillus safensis]